MNDRPIIVKCSDEAYSIYWGDTALDRMRRAEALLSQVAEVYWLCEGNKLDTRQQDLLDYIELAVRKLKESF